MDLHYGPQIWAPNMDPQARPNMAAHDGTLYTTTIALKADTIKMPHFRQPMSSAHISKWAPFLRHAWRAWRA
jgi:hypothetical protein